MRLTELLGAYYPAVRTLAVDGQIRSTDLAVSATLWPRLLLVPPPEITLQFQAAAFGHLDDSAPQLERLVDLTPPLSRAACLLAVGMTRQEIIAFTGWSDRLFHNHCQRLRLRWYLAPATSRFSLAMYAAQMGYAPKPLRSAALMQAWWRNLDSDEREWCQRRAAGTNPVPGAELQDLIFDSIDIQATSALPLIMATVNPEFGTTLDWQPLDEAISLDEQEELHLDLLSLGWRRRQLSWYFGRTSEAVKEIEERLMDRLDARSRVHLALFWLRRKGVL